MRPTMQKNILLFWLIGFFIFAYVLPGHQLGLYITQSHYYYIMHIDLSGRHCISYEDGWLQSTS